MEVLTWNVNGHPFKVEKLIAPHLEIILWGNYDPKLPEYTPKVILDLGANCGAFSIWATWKWPGCEIYAYEPCQETYDLLQTNLTSYPNVKTFKQAVADGHGIGRLHHARVNTGAHSLSTIDGENPEDFEEVEVVSGGSLPPADFLKIDTEGAEIPILTTYQHLAGVRVVALEWHRPADYIWLQEWLKGQGFTLIRKFHYGPESGEGIWARV